MRVVRKSLLLGCFLVVLPGVVVAQKATLELYSGLYRASEDTVAEEPIYGVRGGYDFGKSWGIEVSAGQFEETVEVTVDAGGFDQPIRLQVFLLDFSFVWRPLGDRWLLFAGPGLADIDIELSPVSADDPPVLTDRNVSWHVGTALRWSLTPGFYLRADIRARINETDLYDGEDSEISLAAGWRF